MSQKRHAKARACANIAVVKYWGKRADAMKLPAVGSISLTLAGLTTETELEFCSELECDEFLINGVRNQKDQDRVSGFLDIIREKMNEPAHARIKTQNNFPTGAGLASSASGFAALAVVAAKAAGLKLEERELSVLSRRGSSSAARSIFGGFVEMKRGESESGEDSHGIPLAAAEHWPLQVVVAVASSKRKTVGSTVGMKLTQETSPYYSTWCRDQERDLQDMRCAIETRDFEAFARITESSCMKMHSTMLTTQPPLLYWNSVTVGCLHALQALQRKGVPVCYTMDAGPQVKAICLPEAQETVSDSLRQVPGVVDVLQTSLGGPASVLE